MECRAQLKAQLPTAQIYTHVLLYYYCHFLSVKNLLLKKTFCAYVSKFSDVTSKFSIVAILVQLP